MSIHKIKYVLIALMYFTFFTTYAEANETKVQRLKEKYNSNADFHVVVDLIFDLANKVSKQDIDDAIYLLQQVDDALTLINDEGIQISE